MSYNSIPYKICVYNLYKVHIPTLLFPQKGIFEVKGYFYPSGKTVIMEPQNAAMFITDGKKMKMVLRENATVLEFLHEFMHFPSQQSLLQGTLRKQLTNYFSLIQILKSNKQKAYIFLLSRVSCKGLCVNN